MSSNAQASNKKHILLNNFRSKRSLVMKFGQFMFYYKKKIIKNFYEKCCLETSSRPFLILIASFIKKKSEKVNVLIQTNFDSFANTYLISVDFFKNSILQQRLCLILFQHKRAWNYFQVPDFAEFLNNFFFFFNVTQTEQIALTDCLLPKLFSKIYFLF